VFNVVKLSAALEDPILGRKPQAPLLPIVVDGEKEWEVEEILDSCWHQRRFQFLVKWKGFSREYNSWETTIRGPLIHNPGAPPIAFQHNFIVQPLVTKEWNARAF